jgi:hypothetical protein
VTVYLWDFSSRFAVFEPGPGEDPEVLSIRQTRPDIHHWSTPKVVETYEVRGKPADPGDFPGTTGFMHLLSPKAVELAGALFREFGTLYPLEITGAANGWVLFNPTNVVDCLNLSASRVKRLPFRPDEIYAIDVPVFHEDKVPREGMFIVPECPHGDIYVCENVRQRVEQLALRGFVLKTSRSAKNIWIS